MNKKEKVPKVPKRKNKFPDHTDSIVNIYSPDGYEGIDIITVSKDGWVYCKCNLSYIIFYLVWNLEEKTQSKVKIEREFSYNQLQDLTGKE